MIDQECINIWEKELLPKIQDTFLNIMDLYLFQNDFPTMELDVPGFGKETVIDYRAANAEAHEQAKLLMTWIFSDLHSVLNVLWMSSVKPLESGATLVKLEIKNYQYLNISAIVLRQLVEKLNKHPANVSH